MDDTAVIKEEIPDSEFDAFTDGTTVHKKYQLRGTKPKQKIEESPVRKTQKKSIKYIDDQTHNCPKCIKSFDSKTGLLNHLRMHDVVRKFTCALCNEVFDTNEQLIKHKIIHKGEDRVFLCKICKVAYTDHCDFLVHDISHTKKKTYKCLECTMYFEPSYIKLHIETHFDRSVDCDICGKTYQGQNRLKYHMKTHDTSTHIQCGECGRICKEKAFYNYHMASHTGVKSYQCLYCGKGFANNQQRKIHMNRIHTNNRPHQCSICDGKFKTNGDLKGHMNTHEKEKKIKCDECGKKFFHKQSLQFHLRLHSKENLYECPDCGKKCQTRQGLKMHMVYIHIDSKDFKCELCNLSYKTIGAIRRHNTSKMHRRAEYGNIKKDKD